MQRLRKGLAVAAVTLAIGSVAAGCGSGVPEDDLFAGLRAPGGAAAGGAS